MITETRKKIIELIEPYMNKTLSEGCLIKDKYGYTKIAYNYNGGQFINIINSTNCPNKSDISIIGHYDITAIIKIFLDVLKITKNELIIFLDNREYKLPNKPLNLYTEDEDEKLLELLENTGSILLNVKYFQEKLGDQSQDFQELKRLVEESKGVISWEKLKEFTRVENGKVEGIYWKGDLNLSGSKLKSLGKLKKVGGRLDCECLESLEDLGELEEVGEWLDLRGSRVKSLGKLKKIGGWLICEGLESLEDLGSLEEVGGDLDLRGSRVKNIGNIKVG